MRAFTHFSIPIKGLKNGIHEYKYKVDDEFFSKFENGVVQKGQVEVFLELDKRSDHLELIFDIQGYIDTECDRCTADIKLPIDEEQVLMVKYNTELETMDDEVWYITNDTQTINLAQIIYEFISLSVPFIKVYDCEDEDNPPCNMEVKEKLEEKDQEKNAKEVNPLAEVLKNIKLN